MITDIVAFTIDRKHLWTYELATIDGNQLLVLIQHLPAGAAVEIIKYHG